MPVPIVAIHVMPAAIHVVPVHVMAVAAHALVVVTLGGGRHNREQAERETGREGKAEFHGISPVRSNKS